MPNHERSPAELKLLKAAAAHRSWARTRDRTARTAAGRRAFIDSFADKVDPTGELPEHVREQMAESERRAYFAALAVRSVEVRRARRAAL